MSKSTIEKIELERLLSDDANGMWAELLETGIRDDTDLKVVDNYAERMEKGDTFPPIVVFRDGDKLHVADGFHRIQAAEKLTFKTIDAEIREGTRLDAVWFALGANRQHGHQLSANDKRCAILRALKEFPEKSQNQIADQIGVSQQYVGKIKSEVTTSCNLPMPERVTGKDGKSYPAKQPKATPTTSTSDDEPVPSTPPTAKVWIAPELRDDDEVDEATPEPVEGEKVESAKPDRVTKPETLRSCWMKASKSERETFLQWVDAERTKDLPKGDHRDVYRLVARLKRALKKHPAGRGFLRVELGLEEPTP